MNLIGGKVSATIEEGKASSPSASLLADTDLTRTIAWREGVALTASDFLADVLTLATRLPTAGYAVNLCEDRYRFLVAFCAVAVAGQTNLLPTSRAPQAVAEVLHAYPHSYVLSDQALDPVPALFFRVPSFCANAENLPTVVPQIALDHVIAIGFTSGTTGAPRANQKTWRSLCASSALNAQLLMYPPTRILIPGQQFTTATTTVVTVVGFRLAELVLRHH